jgi:Mor family transcriptional regulator
VSFLDALVDRAHRIAVAVGADPYHARLIADRLGKELAEEHGGERVYVSNGADRKMLADRDAGICRDRRQGKSWRAIARKWGVSQTQARRIYALTVPQTGSRPAHAND